MNDLTDISGNEADSKLFADDLKLYSSYALDSANLLDSGKITILTLLDMSAAFDTLDHATLLHRLKRQTYI